jgi:voltage-dependent potassium channel beta subunit
MEYRKLGSTGLKVSQFSYGSWVTFGKQMELAPVVECLKLAWDKGINFFDNAEVYANGKSEELMGQAIRKLGIPRQHLVISTKFFWGIENAVNFKNTLNRKYLMYAIDQSLKRLQMDYVDLVFCHRPDSETPIEETVMAMHDMIQQGKALYWGTSEWSAQQIEKAYDFAVQNSLHRPHFEQPQYNLIHSQKVENEFAPLYPKMGLGLTVWSPLASGILTGKYQRSIPSDSRLAMTNMSWLQEELRAPRTQSIMQGLSETSQKSHISMTELALGWCTLNPKVSTVILGASRTEQLLANLETLKKLDQIRAVKKQLDELTLKN